MYTLDKFFTLDWLILPNLNLKYVSNIFFNFSTLGRLILPCVALADWLRGLPIK